MNNTNYSALLRMEKKHIHCITNYITATDCANILLAAGASPTMAHHPMEMEDIQSGCDALVCNLGATESFDAMLLAAACATEKNHPIIIDPVGCGGSSFRRDFFYQLAKTYSPTCIRGNYAEILALAHNTSTITGVDANASASDVQIAQVRSAALKLAKEYHCYVIASGKVDVVADLVDVVELHSGDEMMRSITGSGCMSSCLLGAYIAMECSFSSVISCLNRIGHAGETAAKKAREQGCGSMTFKNFFIDEIYLS